MMPLKATNNFIFIIRDKAESEKAGLVFPTAGLAKTNSGTVYSVGSLVKDSNIKSAKGRQCLFHSGCGFGISYEDVEYHVLSDNEIIAIL